jgi:hypothetical protein
MTRMKMSATNVTAEPGLLLKNSSEFERWLAAVPDERARIARDVFNKYSPAELLECLPDRTVLQTNPEDAIAPKGKRLADVTEAELGELADWMQDIHRAAQDSVAAIALGGATSGFVI